MHALVLYLMTLVSSLAIPWGGPAVAHASKPHRLFSPHSVWNSPLPRRARIDPSSALRVGALADDLQWKAQRRMYPNIAGQAYGATLYVVQRRQRRVRVALDTGSWRLPLEHALEAGVPIPARAHPAKGTDGQMVIYQPSTDTIWEFWRAVRRRDGWHASWGGAIRRV